MLLTGTYPRTLDDKNRLALPKRVRELLGNPEILFITPGPDQCLWVYTQECLERLAQKLDQARPNSEEAETYKRLFFARSEVVNVDRAGRILLHDRFVQGLGLKPELVLIGVRDRLEIWDAERWEKYLADNTPRFATVATAAFGGTT